MNFKSLLIVGIIMLGAIFASAQTIQDFEKEINEIKRTVGLDDDQYSKLRAIYEKRVKDLQLIKEENQDDLTYRQRRIAVYNSSNFSVRRLIRSEQKSNFDIYRKNVRIRKAKGLKTLKLDQGQKLNELTLKEHNLSIIK